MERSHENLAPNQARALNPSQPIHDPRDVRRIKRVAVQVRVRKGVGKVTTKNPYRRAERALTEDQHKRAAAVSETKPKIKKCNCMPTCSHKFCGCAAHY